MVFTKNIKFPNTFPIHTGRTALVNEIEAINQSIRLLLTTAKGELFGDPEFGCNLYSYLYDNEGEALYQIIREDIVKTLNEQEPRVFLQDKDITIVEEGTNLNVTVAYNIRYTDYTDNFAFLIERRQEVA